MLFQEFVDGAGLRVGFGEEVDVDLEGGLFRFDHYEL